MCTSVIHCVLHCVSATQRQIVFCHHMFDPLYPLLFPPPFPLVTAILLSVSMSFNVKSYHVTQQLPLGYLPERFENIYLQRYMLPYIHCSIIHSGQDLETAKVSFDR